MPARKAQSCNRESGKCGRWHVVFTKGLEGWVNDCYDTEVVAAIFIIQGAALPVVIDFGIAKATTNQRLTDKTLFTAFEMLIGTPAYMSPEQAALTSVDVDTRTDIYSLGVLLYELLTGATPFDTGNLLKAGLDEIRRVIREEEPVRPSARLITMPGADLTKVAQHRKSERPQH